MKNILILTLAVMVIMVGVCTVEAGRTNGSELRSPFTTAVKNVNTNAVPVPKVTVPRATVKAAVKIETPQAKAGSAVSGLTGQSAQQTTGSKRQSVSVSTTSMFGTSGARSTSTRSTSAFGSAMRSLFGGK